MVNFIYKHFRVQRSQTLLIGNRPCTLPERSQNTAEQHTSKATPAAQTNSSPPEIQLTRSAAIANHKSSRAAHTLTLIWSCFFLNEAASSSLCFFISSLACFSFLADSASASFLAFSSAFSSCARSSSSASRRSWGMSIQKWMSIGAERRERQGGRGRNREK